MKNLMLLLIAITSCALIGLSGFMATDSLWSVGFTLPLAGVVGWIIADAERHLYGKTNDFPKRDRNRYE